MGNENSVIRNEDGGGGLVTGFVGSGSLGNVRTPSQGGMSRGRSKSQLQPKPSPSADMPGKNTINEIQVLEGHNDIVRLLLRIDDTRFASASDEGVVIIWNHVSGEQIARLSEHTQPITCLLKLSDNILITGSADKTIRMWSLNTYECVKLLTLHTGSVKCLAVLNDQQFCSAGNDRYIYIWRNNGELVGSIERQEEENLNCLLPIAGNRIVTGSNSSLLLVYKTNTLVFDKLLAFHRESVRCLVALPETILFASGSLDGSIVVWHTETLTPLKILNYPDVYRDEDRIFVYNVAVLLPFAERYLIAAIGKGFRMYDIVSGDCVVEVNKAHESDILHIVCLSDSLFSIATCSADSSIRLWKNRQVNSSLRYDSSGSSAGSRGGISKTPKMEAICQGEMYVHSEMVNNMLFIESGVFASCGGDGLIILWKDGALQSEIRNRYAVLSLRQQVQALLEKDHLSSFSTPQSILPSSSSSSSFSSSPFLSSSSSTIVSSGGSKSELENTTTTHYIGGTTPTNNNNNNNNNDLSTTPMVTIKGRSWVPESVINHALKLKRERHLSMEEIADDLRSNIGCSESIVKATIGQLLTLASEEKERKEKEKQRQMEMEKEKEKEKQSEENQKKDTETTTNF